MKKLLIIVVLCFILLGSPAVSLAQTLTLSQLQAIVASLQAQLNALIAQLNLIQQQENNSKPIVRPIESIKPAIVVKSPEGGDTWSQGKSYTISWTGFRGDFDAYNVLIGNYLVPGVKGGLPPVARVSKNMTSTKFDPRDLSDNYIKTWILNASSYGLKVSERDLRRNFYYTIQAVQDLPNGKEKIIASGEGGKFSILKNNDDEIAAMPTIEMLSPNGGEKYEVGDRVSVRWKTYGLPQNVDSQLSLMDDRIPGWQTRSFFGSAPVLNYATLVSSNGSENIYEYNFVVPSNFNSTLPEHYRNIFGGKHYKINVVAVFNPQGKTLSERVITDYSNNSFALGSESSLQPLLNVVTPNGGESYTQGSSYNTGDYLPHRITVKNVTSNGNTSIYMKSTDGSQKKFISGARWELPLPNPINDYGSMQLNNTLNPGQYYLWAEWRGDDGSYSSDQSDSPFIVKSPDSLSIRSSLTVSVLKGGIQCFRAPCEFPLGGAEVSVYNSSKVLVGTKTVGVDGVAIFTNLSPGTYTIYASAPGYIKSNASVVGVLVNQSATAKILLNLVPLPQAATNPDLASVLQSLQGVLQGLSGSLGH